MNEPSIPRRMTAVEITRPGGPEVLVPTLRRANRFDGFPDLFRIKEIDMKLRLKGNSVRVRLDRRDLQGLIDRGRIDDAVQFGPGLALSYAVEMGPALRGRPRASYADGSLTIRIDPEDAEEWLVGDRVGFDHNQVVDGGVVRVLLEKDFACIDRPAGEVAEDAYAFPNPSAVC